MTRRSVAVRLTLVVACLATMATSPPRNYELTATDERSLAPGAVRIHALANKAGVAHADELTLTLILRSAAGSAPSTTVTLIPDDPAMPSEVVALGAVGAFSVQRNYDLIALCSRDRDCDAGVTIEVPGDSTVIVTATASLIRFGDPSFVLPDDRSFPDDAAVELGFAP
jgi:hypothetical protein